MIKMEIESQNEGGLMQQVHPTYSYLIAYAPPQDRASLATSKIKDSNCSHSLSTEEVRVLKTKQEKNILNKIEKIVQKVTPIHQAEYQSQNQNDMHDLIEQFQKMDLQ